jgi:hypothetical protein
MAVKCGSGRHLEAKADAGAPAGNSFRGLVLGAQVRSLEKKGDWDKIAGKAIATKSGDGAVRAVQVLADNEQLGCLRDVALGRKAAFGRPDKANEAALEAICAAGCYEVLCEVAIKAKSREVASSAVEKLARLGSWDSLGVVAVEREGVSGYSDGVNIEAVDALARAGEWAHLEPVASDAAAKVGDYAHRKFRDVTEEGLALAAEGNLGALGAIARRAPEPLSSKARKAFSEVGDSALAKAEDNADWLAVREIACYARDSVARKAVDVLVGGYKYLGEDDKGGFLRHVTLYARGDSKIYALEKLGAADI